MVLRYWNTRYRRFGTQAATDTLQSVSSSGIKLGLGSIGLITAGSLIVGQIIGNSLGTFLLLRQTLKHDFALLKTSFSLNNIRVQLETYKDFPQINTWGALLNTVSVSLPVFLLVLFFSWSSVGLYSLGYQILTLPMSFIGVSIGQVFYQRAAVAKHHGNLETLVEDILYILLIICIIPIIVILISGKTLFLVVFGAEWADAGFYAQILSIWIFMVFITSPISTLISVLNLQKFNLIMNIILFFTRIITLAIGGFFQNIILALFLFSISGTVIMGYNNYYYVKKSGANQLKIMRGIRKYLAPIIILTLLLSSIQIIVYNPYVVFLSAILIVGGYEIYLFQTDRKIKEYFSIKSQ
jgi:O-antigen/teichoic acid export membrane protein